MGEALYLSCFLINRSPTDELDITLSEMWTGQRPSLKNLKIFGCVA